MTLISHLLNKIVQRCFKVIECVIEPTIFIVLKSLQTESCSHCYWPPGYHPLHGILIRGRHPPQTFVPPLILLINLQICPLPFPCHPCDRNCHFTSPLSPCPISSQFPSLSKTTVPDLLMDSRVSPALKLFTVAEDNSSIESVEIQSAINLSKRKRVDIVKK